MFPNHKYFISVIIAFIYTLSGISQSPIPQPEEKRFPGYNELISLYSYLENNSPKKKTGYLEWEYKVLKKGKVLATPLEEGIDNLVVLSTWIKDNPVLTLLASDSNDVYDQIRIDPILANGWEVQLFFSNDAIPTIERIEVFKNNSHYQIFKRLPHGYFLKVPLNNKFTGFIEVDSTFKILNNAYVWDNSIDDYKFFFPFVYAGSDIEQVFIKYDKYWFEVVFSLFDAKIEAIAKHEGTPGNMKELLINEISGSSSSVFIEFNSKGNKISKVDAEDYLKQNENISEVHTVIGDFIEKISKDYVQISSQFDIPFVFNLAPFKILKFSSY